jgi:hypothetical protein
LNSKNKLKILEFQRTNSSEDPMNDIQNQLQLRTSRTRAVGFAGGALLLGAIMLACSSTTNGDDGASSSGGTSGSSSGCGINGCTSGGSTSGDPTMPEILPDEEACASSNIAASKAAVHLVFSVDVTGSMCQIADDEDAPEDPATCNRPATKWSQVRGGLGNFFTTTKDADLSVSLIPWSARQFGVNYCEGATFNKSLVPATTTLPSMLPSTELNKIAPGGLTPTAGAIRGAVNYMGTVKGTLDGGKIVLVLVTDGVPNVCPHTPEKLEAASRQGQAAFDKLLQASVAESAKVAGESKTQGFPVYVIGVGGAVGNLETIAAAGGTEHAVLIKNTDPNKVGAQLLETLEKIRGQVSGCDIRIPPSKDGTALSYDKVNLSVEMAGAAKRYLPYSPDCSNPEGWKYNVPPGGASPPSRIELCTNSCATTKANPKISLKLKLGCQSKGVVN